MGMRRTAGSRVRWLVIRAGSIRRVERWGPHPRGLTTIEAAAAVATGSTPTARHVSARVQEPAPRECCMVVAPRPDGHAEHLRGAGTTCHPGNDLVLKLNAPSKAPVD